MVFNEFLSISYDINQLKEFLYWGNLKDVLVPVLYTFTINKDLADNILNIFSFIEDSSDLSQEKEVLLATSVIFKLQSVEKKFCFSNLRSYYDGSAFYVSNGYNKFEIF